MIRAPQYSLNLSKFCFIWFSTDPNEFLPTLNKVRLIKRRIENPQTALSLIYSKQCLTEAALQDLISFCEKNNIKPVIRDYLKRTP